MPVFLVLEKEKYLVKDPLCLGKSCLVLGKKLVKRHPLTVFDGEWYREIPCCITGVHYDRFSCPTQVKFEKPVRKENIDKGMAIRLI